MGNESRTGADAPKGVVGIKASEYTTPERAFGEGVRDNDIPEGARTYMKESAIPLGGQVTVVNLYRLVDDGGTKNKKSWVAKFSRRPEDVEIAEQFGPGRFVWMMKWATAGGGETGIISEPVDIDEACRPMHEAYLRKRGEMLRGADSIPASTGAGQVAPVAPAGAPTVMDLLKMMEAGEEKAIRTMERMSAILKPGGQDPVGAMAGVMGQVHEAAIKVMEKSLNSSMSMAQAAVDKVRGNMVDRDDDDDGDGEGESAGEAAPAAPANGLPAWLAPFIPKVETYLGTLLGGGPVGGAVKTLIVNSDDWKEIFNDKDKWGVAVAAMEQHFGSEKTNAALDKLLDRPKERARIAKAEELARLEALKAAKKVSRADKSKRK